MEEAKPSHVKQRGVSCLWWPKARTDVSRAETVGFAVSGGGQGHHACPTLVPKMETLPRACIWLHWQGGERQQRGASWCLGHQGSARPRKTSRALLCGPAGAASPRRHHQGCSWAGIQVMGTLDFPGPALIPALQAGPGSCAARAGSSLGRGGGRGQHPPGLAGRQGREGRAQEPSCSARLWTISHKPVRRRTS